MIKAISYSRYSSEKQNDSSIDDQQRNIARYAESECIEIVKQYADRAISGSDNSRPEYLEVKKLINGGSSIKCVMVDSIDRLSRDNAETTQLLKAAEFHGVTIIAVSNGFNSSIKGSKLLGGIQSVLAEQYVTDLKEKTHRGMTGSAINGKPTGGKIYGYLTQLENSRPVYVIHEEEAAVVRSIFDEYNSGKSAKKIALALNDQGVLSPRGGKWSHSTILGCAKKGSGILRNERYVGRFAWNKTQWKKDPDSGRRICFARGKDEIEECYLPELAIVDDLVWHQTKRRLDATTKANAKDGRTGKRKYKFKYAISSLFKCPCGAWYSKVNGQRFGCGSHFNKGHSACENKTTYAQKDLEQFVVDELTKLRCDTTLLDAAYREYQSLLANDEIGDKIKTHTKRLNVIERELESLVQALIALGVSDTVTAKIKSLESEKVQIGEEVQSLETDRIITKPMNEKEFKQRVYDVFEDLDLNDINKNPEHVRQSLIDIFGVLAIDEVKNVVGSSGSGGRI